jgi:hypothetical protein
VKMRSLALPLILAILAFPGALRATTTVSGHVFDLGGNPAPRGTFVRFYLRGCGGNQPTVPGVATLAPTNGSVWYIDLPSDNSGNVSGTLYSTRDAAGTGNGEIECGNSFTAVWYGMQVWLAGKSGPEIPVHAKNGATLDPSSVTPISTSPVVTAPTGDGTYARLDGGNQPFLATVQAPRLQSTVATGTAPLIVASNTVVPNLNASLLGGQSAPASTILGLTDTQAPTNKTFDISLNTFKNSSNTAGHVPRNNGTQYVDGQLAAADLSNGVIGSGAVALATALQGTDANLLTSGTVSASTGVPLCTDANHGATTSGCVSGIPVTAVDLTGKTANVSATTLVTPGANGFYRFSCFIVETANAGTTSTLPNCEVIFTDADSSTPLGIIVATSNTNNTVGSVGQQTTTGFNAAPTFYAKSGVAIQYATNNYASNPASTMTYAVHIRLEGPF